MRYCLSLYRLVQLIVLCCSSSCAAYQAPNILMITRLLHVMLSVAHDDWHKLVLSVFAFMVLRECRELTDRLDCHVLGTDQRMVG